MRRLRKYGVRFGAYHIYLPASAQTGAARACRATLGARSRGTESKGLDDLLHLAGSGRTSIPVNREIDASALSCGRISGLRRARRACRYSRAACRSDPSGAGLARRRRRETAGRVPGGGFTIVNGMTSLTGASGEDFASILRSLGYRMERRPKPQEPVAEPAAETPAATPTAEAAATDAGAAQIEPAPDVEAARDRYRCFRSTAALTASEAPADPASPTPAETTDHNPLCSRRPKSSRRRSRPKRWRLLFRSTPLHPQKIRKRRRHSLPKNPL